MSTQARAPAQGSDLLSRLRLIAAWHKPAGPWPPAPEPNVYKAVLEAIAEIERLQGNTP